MFEKTKQHYTAELEKKYLARKALVKKPIKRSNEVSDSDTDDTRELDLYRPAGNSQFSLFLMME
jgi:hypothetical protein